MSHQVSVWRAAQLLGVARGVLQQKVREGSLVLNDGWVSTDVLLQLYPDAQLEESGLLERVSQIRDEAFGKRVRERLLPSQEVLAQRLFGGVVVAVPQPLPAWRASCQRWYEGKGLLHCQRIGARQQQLEFDFGRVHVGSFACVASSVAWGRSFGL